MADRRDLLAAIGEVVVCTARLELAVAILVAVTDGLRDQAAEVRAEAIIAERPGKALDELRRISRECPERQDLKLALHDAKSVVSDRHILAHSVTLEDTKVDELPAIVMRNAREQAEATITLPQILSLAHDIRIAHKRIYKIVEAATARRRPPNSDG